MLIAYLGIDGNSIHHPWTSALKLLALRTDAYVGEDSRIQKSTILEEVVAEAVLGYPDNNMASLILERAEDISPTAAKKVR